MRITIPCMLCAVIVAFSVAVAWADPEETKLTRDSNATQVAKAWFTSLMQGETAVTTSLSDVPFTFDAKQEIKSYSDLKQRYDQVVETKGKRELKPTSATIKSSSPGKIELILEIEDFDEGIVVVIKPGEVFRVVGFVD